MKLWGPVVKKHNIKADSLGRIGRRIFTLLPEQTSLLRAAREPEIRLRVFKAKRDERRDRHGTTELPSVSRLRKNGTRRPFWGTPKAARVQLFHCPFFRLLKRALLKRALLKRALDNVTGLVPERRILQNCAVNHAPGTSACATATSLAPTAQRCRLRPPLRLRSFNEELATSTADTPSGSAADATRPTGRKSEERMERHVRIYARSQMLGFACSGRDKLACLGQLAGQL